MRKTCLEWALELLLRLYLWPVAIKPGEKAPIGESWGSTRPTERSIKGTFKRHPEAGVGLVLGPDAGVIDIECDGPDGEDSLARLVGGEIVLTLGWSSARGPHHIFRYDARLARYGKSIIKLPELPGLEIRIGGDGKQLQSCCPPTIGSDGRPREWNGNWIIADLPDAVFTFLNAAFGKPCTNRGTEARSMTMTVSSNRAAYAAKALDEECQNLALAVGGEQNETLNKAAFNLGQLVGAGVLDRSEVERCLLDAAAAYVVKDGEHAARATVRSGLDAGQKQPRNLAHLDGSPEPGRNGLATAPAPWPRFRIDTMPCAEPFPADILPPAARRLVTEASDAIGCPPDFLAVPMLAMASGVIGRSVSLLLKQGYFASSTLYVGCVGPPSDGKSPALRIVSEGVKRIDRVLKAEHDQAMLAWQAACDATSPKSGKSKPPRPRRIVIDDATMEVIPLILEDNPRGLIMIRDELTAFLLGMNQYKAGGKGSDR